MRQAFDTRVPDGSFSFRDYLDSDGITDQSYAVHLTLVKEQRHSQSGFFQDR